MSWMTLMRVGADTPIGGATSQSQADPQLQFFENFPGHLVNGLIAFSQNRLSVHAINIPLSISFNKVLFLRSRAGALPGDPNEITHYFGLYSLNGSTLSLANSASLNYDPDSDANGISWVSFSSTSATQNITPGTWYFGFLISSANAGVEWSIYGNSSINPGNAIPGQFLMGRLTVTTGALPASVATSDFDITGSDAIRQPYIIITA